MLSRKANERTLSLKPDINKMKKVFYLSIFFFFSINLFGQGVHKDGEFKEYWLNGQVKNIGTYKNDKKEGEWKEYDVEGKIKTMGIYKEDKKEGEWKVYNNRGNVDSIVLYKEDKKEDEWNLILMEK